MSDRKPNPTFVVPPDAPPGDLLVWADEAAGTRHATAARLRAGQALLHQRVFTLALEQFDAVLAADASHPLLKVQARSGRLQCLAGLGAPEGPPAAAVMAGHQGPVSGLGPGPGPAPGRVLLFSGHMVDAPHRPQPRFPPALVPAAAAAIAERLDALSAGALDLALTQGAAGGDLLFAQACLRRNVPLRLLLPLAQAEFIAASVLPSCDGGGGGGWRSHFLALLQQLPQPPREMPTALGPAPPGSDVFERCNRWLLHTALAQGRQRLHFLALWDGGGGDGPGGTRHMMAQVRQRGGDVIWIDLRTLHP